MLDWDTQHIAQQLRFGSYLGSRQLYELGVMMLSEGEPQLKLPRLNTSNNSSNLDANTVSRMNDQSVRQYLSMHLAEANKAKETINTPNLQSASPSTDNRHCIPSRKQREFINDTYKDEHYWEKRRKNNDAARRSREKRRYHDMVLEGRIHDLSKDNCLLRNELSAIKRKFNLPLEQPFKDPDDDTQQVGSTSIPSSSSPNIQYSNSSSMVPSKPSHTTNKGVPYSSPPPLLAVTGAMAVPVQGIYPPNGAQYPYYLNMSGSETTLRNNHDSNGSNSSNYTPPRTNSFSSGYQDVKVKEERDDSKSPPPLSIALESDIRPPSDYYSQHHLNQGYSSDSWQGSPSNSNSYGSDEYADQPLQLTVRRDTAESIDRSSDKKESQSSHASSLPLKLRHKLPTQEYYSPLDPSAPFPTRPYVNGLAQLSEIALAQANPLPLSRKNSDLPPQSMDGFTRSSRKDKSGNPKHIDPKYIERRRRNNEAARKCRENRKYVTNMREAKSDYLQQENGKLKDELDSLQEEMKQLRELMEKKRLEQGLTEREMDEKMAASSTMELGEEVRVEVKQLDDYSESS
ncbi:transcription factor atf-2 isoform X1 [Patella vulgata]|uniref:transcription factor atf-2 isoform X1 n=2 Tax=Patella vulgata TaxID=6465 RepID=UPI0024A85BBC|nr:transcription factor atf-2 isoform X1 [Patella vulgata]